MVMLRNDLRYALRLLRRDPGFTAAAVLSLALGIGANTAIFSLVNTVLLRPLPVDHPEQLVELLQRYPGEPRGNGYYALDHLPAFRDNNHVFSHLTGTNFDNLARIRAEGAAEARTVVLENALGNYFPTLGLKPAIGRLFGPGDRDVAVLSWPLWDTRFQRDSGVLGKRLVVNDKPVTVIGVAPRAYAGPRVGARTDLWIPVEKDQVSMLGAPQARRDSRPSPRRGPDPLSIRHRGADCSSKDPQLAKMTMEVESAAAGFSNVRDRLGKPLLLVLGVVGLLLLLACINLASMLLARSAGRRREMAVRVALGASRARLLRQVLSESVLLSAAGALVGVVFAWVGTALLVGILATSRPTSASSSKSPPTFACSYSPSASRSSPASCSGSCPPGMPSVRPPPARSASPAARATTPFWRWFSKGLVAAQVGLSILLVTAAALFLGHLSRLRHDGLGFRSDHVLLVQLDPRGGLQRPARPALSRPSRPLRAFPACVPRASPAARPSRAAASAASSPSQASPSAPRTAVTPPSV